MRDNSGIKNYGETLIDERVMRFALREAMKASRRGDVPVGAVIARSEEIIALAHNRREHSGDVFGHAEILAVRSACRKLGDWRLEGCTLYVTLEPCPMCAGAAINARIARVVYGASDPKGGAFGSVTDLAALPFNHRPEVTGGVLADECSGLLKAFFVSLRER